MANITLSVPDSFKIRMDKHKHIKWSSAIRTQIEKLLDDFERADALAQKSKLTQQDIDEISLKVNEAMGKHARKLLNENRS